MRILLDNCVRFDTKLLLVGHEVAHCIDRGWDQLGNGELLKQADEEYDLVVTIDKNMQYQSSLKGLKIRVAVLAVRGNLQNEIERGVNALLAKIGDLPEGEFTIIE